MEEEKKGSALGKYARLTAIGFEMGAIIFVFVWLGRQADDYFETPKNYYTALGALLGLAASLYLVLKQLKSIK